MHGVPLTVPKLLFLLFSVLKTLHGIWLSELFFLLASCLAMQEYGFLCHSCYFSSFQVTLNDARGNNLHVTV